MNPVEKHYQRIEKSQSKKETSNRTAPCLLQGWLKKKRQENKGIIMTITLIMFVTIRWYIVNVPTQGRRQMVPNTGTRR